MSWGLTMRLAIVAASAAILVGCGATPPSAAVTPPSMAPTPPGADCPKVEVAVILRVDAADPRVVWGMDISSGQAIVVRPLPDLGWTVRPGRDPHTIFGPDGRVATFDGEIFRQACRDEATGTLYVGPEDLPDPDRPAN